jgi:hypothetical protein
MVTIEGHHGSRAIFCTPVCVWSYGAGNPELAVEYVPDGLEASSCQWCTGCGCNLSPHLGMAGCMVHGPHCYGIRRWFLRTRAATDFCRLVWIRTGEVLRIGDSRLWTRAMELWEAPELAGADGLEIYERVMSELA